MRDITKKEKADIKFSNRNTIKAILILSAILMLNTKCVVDMLVWIVQI